MEDTRSPLLGEHNHMVYSEFLGYSRDEIQNLQKEGDSIVTNLPLKVCVSWILPMPGRILISPVLADFGAEVM